MTNATYVTLNPICFDARFQDYPRVLPESEIGRIREACVRARWSWVEEPLAYYLDTLPRAEGGRRIDGAAGWPFVLGDLLASCEVARWQAPHPKSLLNVFNGACFSNSFERGLDGGDREAWRRLANTLAPHRKDPMWSSAPWWRLAMAKDGTYTHGLTSPGERDAIVAGMSANGLLSRVIGEMEAQGDEAYARDLADLVRFLSSDDVAGCWILAWVAPT